MSKLEEAFTIIKRDNFLPEELRKHAHIDRPLPIGYEQTNSQPYTVKLMLEWLDVRPGHKVLDVGSGSGWTTALLSYLVGAKGRVYAVERIPDLVTFGEKNCKNIGITNVEFSQAGPITGLPEKAPYDRILVSAASKEIPTQLIKQLKTEGKLVVPVNTDILEIKKQQSGLLSTTIHNGYVFVPLL
jgi:protein-L-isoaspartate(D-aspartate) O-methyltransferase